MLALLNYIIILALRTKDSLLGQRDPLKKNSMVGLKKKYHHSFLIIVKSPKDQVHKGLGPILIHGHSVQ